MMIINTTKILFAIFLFVIIFFAALFLYLPVSNSNSELEVVIDRGDGASEISQRLYGQGLIRSRYLFLMYVVVSGNDKKLKAGKYILSPSLNIPEIVELISKGLAESDDVTVTIPEGFNIWEIEKSLIGAGLVLEGEFVSKAKNFEGYLFPDTYRFKNVSSVEKIIQKMTANLDSKLREEKLSITADQLIMASILEKEVRSIDDMKIVSGILWKRLGVGMLLQADATVAYGVCWSQATPKLCDISQVPIRINLDIDNPYNSYVRRGLPAGPISNPGLNALKAAVNPVSSEYWFYLSATAEDGRTIFSKTAEEHQRNRTKYLKSLQ